MSEAIAHRLGAERILHPRSVAVIGASEDVGKFGGRVMHYLVKHGYEGRIVPVNPKRDTVFGVSCAPHISKAGGRSMSRFSLCPRICLSRRWPIAPRLGSAPASS